MKVCAFCEMTFTLGAEVNIVGRNTYHGFCYRIMQTGYTKEQVMETKRLGEENRRREERIEV